MMLALYYKAMFILLIVLTCFSISKQKKISNQKDSSHYYEDDTNNPLHSTDDILPFDLDDQLADQTEQNEQISNHHKNHPGSAMPIEQGKNQKILKKNETFSNFMFMDPEMNYFLQWKTNKTHITFNVQVKTLGWVGLGLSPTGGMTNSDMAVMWVENGKLTLQDRFAKGFFEPLIDEKQDWIPLYGYENATHTIVAFTRLLDTCDVEMDRPITRDTVHLLYAYHSKDPPNRQLMKHEYRGSRNVYLLDPIPDFVEPKYTKKITVTANQYKIPHENDTTYRCFISKLKNIDKKYHLIGIKPEIAPESHEFVHHMLLHLCDPRFNNQKHTKEFMCYDSNLSIYIMTHCFTSLLAAWAVGGPGYLHPKDLGYPIGIDLNDRYIVLEVHYNNQNNIDGIVDNSGINLYLTDKLRKIESGELILGSSDFNWGILIPPQQKEFSIYSLCSSDCTNNIAFPEEGLYIYSFFLHTHLAGRKVRVKIIRDGKELEAVMKDDNFDFNYQENRNLAKPIKLMKGDTILTECIYSTENRTDYTYGGLKTTDEMCLVYLGYYPRTDFSVCASKINIQNLSKVIGLKMAKPMELLDIHVNKNVREHLNSTRLRSYKQVRKLANYYYNGDYEVLCRYMALPQIIPGKIPQYTPYVNPPSKCVPPEDDYE